MRKTIALLVVVVFLTASCSIVSLPVKAEPKTITVPDDYPTIASAIENSADGDTIFVKTGSYEGPVNQTLVIDKAISIVGEKTENTTINLRPKYNATYIFPQYYYTYYDSLVISANDVSLTNLTLQFTGTIRANGDRLQITGSSLNSFNWIVIKGSNCKLTKNTLSSSIVLEGSSNTIRQNGFDELMLQSVNSNIIVSNTFQYLRLYSSQNNVISENVVTTKYRSFALEMNDSHNNNFQSNNFTRIAFSYSNNNVIAKNNITTAPYVCAINMENSNSSVFYANNIENMEIFFPSSNNTFFGNSFVGPFIDDDQLIRIGFLKTVSNSWDNGSLGNYWSDYLTKCPNASEIDNSGIGNTPYVVSPSHSEFDPIAYVDHFPLIHPFSDEVSKESEPFPTTLVIGSITAVALVGLGLLVFLKKRGGGKTQ